MKGIDKLGQLTSSVLLFVFALIVFHAPISVFFSQFFVPEIVKAWKEVLLLLLVPLVFWAVLRSGSWGRVRRDYLLTFISIYALLHVVLLVIPTTSYQKTAGMAIDLRFLLFFSLIYLVIGIWPVLRKRFLVVALASSALSIFFALLQATILPKDILKHLGYSKDTIQPYLNVDKNSDFIRINGTFRGPNPLGAYMAGVLSLFSAWVFGHKRSAKKYTWLLVSFCIFTLVVLWASYSRSAWIAALLGVFIVIYIKFNKFFTLKNTTVVLVSGLLVAVVSSSVLQKSNFYQNVVLHNNPTSGSRIDSNQEHTSSLSEGLGRLLMQPYGAGIGSTGSASLGSSKPLILENQYLFVAHETGWFGLGLFVTIFAIILGRLYKNRSDWLCLGLFASGIGLGVAGLFLPVWVDDTVSLVWFGLAAVALGSHIQNGRKNVKKAN